MAHAVRVRRVRPTQRRRIWSKAPAATPKSFIWRQRRALWRERNKFWQRPRRRYVFSKAPPKAPPPRQREQVWPKKSAELRLWQRPRRRYVFSKTPVAPTTKAPVLRRRLQHWQAWQKPTLWPWWQQRSISIDSGRAVTITGLRPLTLRDRTLNLTLPKRSSTLHLTRRSRLLTVSDL